MCSFMYFEKASVGTFFRTILAYALLRLGMCLEMFLEAIFFIKALLTVLTIKKRFFRGYGCLVGDRIFIQV